MRVHKTIFPTQLNAFKLFDVLIFIKYTQTNVRVQQVTSEELLQLESVYNVKLNKFAHTSK